MGYQDDLKAASRNDVGNVEDVDKAIAFHLKAHAAAEAAEIKQREEEAQRQAEHERHVEAMAKTAWDNEMRARGINPAFSPYVPAWQRAVFKARDFLHEANRLLDSIRSERKELENQMVLDAEAAYRARGQKQLDGFAVFGMPTDPGLKSDLDMLQDRLSDLREQLRQNGRG